MASNQDSFKCSLQAGDAGSLTVDVTAFQDAVKTTLGYIGNYSQSPLIQEKNILLLQLQTIQH